MEKRKTKKAGSIWTVFCCLLLLWMVFSFAEVNAKNLTENPTYSEYNFFVMLTENI